MTRKQRVFVTGASSELMLQVLAKVDTERFDITGLTRSKNALDYNGIRWLEGDIQNSEQYLKFVVESDIIIHAAAITHSKTQKDYFDVNHEGTRKLISCISKEKKPLFVFISSRVAGEGSGAYGVSKLRAEEEVKKLKKWVVIRPSEVYGGTKSEGIEKTIHDAINGGVQLCPAGVESKMYPIHISDTVDVIFEAAFEKIKENQTIVLNGSVGYSFKELLLMIERVSGRKITIVLIPRWFLGLVGIVSKLLPMDIGFVPDQVARLYSKKTYTEAAKTTVELESYIGEIVKRQNEG
jgi:nucleoside-diphosphate-sugar epimerase